MDMIEIKDAAQRLEEIGSAFFSITTAWDFAGDFWIECIRRDPDGAWRVTCSNPQRLIEQMAACDDEWRMDGNDVIFRLYKHLE